MHLSTGRAAERVGSEASARDRRVYGAGVGALVHWSGPGDRRGVHLADDGAAAEEPVGVPQELRGHQQPEPDLGRHRTQQPPLMCRETQTPCSVHSAGA